MLGRTWGLGRFRRFGVAAAAAALLLLWGLPGVAQAAFLSPVEVSRLGDQPQLGVRPDGTAIIAFREGSFLRARRINLNGSLGPSLDLSNGASRPSGHDLAVDPSGRTTVAWLELSGVIKARRINANDSLGSLLTLSDEQAEALPPSVAVDAKGNATIAWRAESSNPTSHVVEARRLNADGSLGPINELYATSALWGTYARVGVGPAGDAMVVWIATIPFSGFRGLYARQFRVDGSLGPTQTLVDTGYADNAGVVVDARGKATVVWDWWSYCANCGKHEVHSQTINPDGSLGPDRLLSQPGTYVSSWQPSVAVDSFGSVTVAWTSSGPLEIQSVQSRSLDPFGTPGPIRTLRSAWDEPSFWHPQVVRGTWGQAISWETDACCDPRIKTLEARRAMPGGSLGPVEIVARHEPYLRESQLAADALGNLSVAWEVSKQDGAGLTVLAAQQILPPSCKKSSVAVARGTAKSIAMRCTGLAITQTSIVTGPEHGRLGVVWRTPTGGTVTYTPDPSYTGPDSFTFKAENRGGESAPGTVRITVG